MITLGIHDGHTASACIVKDGKILSCISEERLNRIKEYCGFPELAIKKCLEINGISPEMINQVGIAGLSVPTKSMHDLKKPKGLKSIYNTLSIFLPGCFLGSNIWSKTAISLLALFRNKKAIKEKLQDIGIKAKIDYYDHHYLHCLGAFACSPFYSNQAGKQEKVLIFTCDASGDLISSTVNIGEKKKLTRLYSMNSYHSLGEFYTRITQFLGMKPCSEEFKVMGLAGYSNFTFARKTYNKLRDFIKVRFHSYGFQNRSNTTKWQYLPKLKRILKYHRFDNIAFSAQKILEEILAEWISRCIRKTGIHRIVLSGGVFLNIKANYRILKLPEVERLWILPSCSDDSLSIGAALEASRKIGNSDFKQLKDVYLGPEYTNDDIEKILNEHKEEFRIRKIPEIDEYVGKKLANGNIIARFAGRMEWGARALGNRSILADPRDLSVVSRINKFIKKREFWMPYAPSILEGHEDKYFKTLKRIEAYYMIIAFPATAKAVKEIPAAIHSFDHTLRPQVVTEHSNKGFYTVIKSFAKETGVGCVLNTSFNLNRSPIVCSPSDALKVFIKSDLDALALEHYYIEKIVN